MPSGGDDVGAVRQAALAGARAAVDDRRAGAGCDGDHVSRGGLEQLRIDRLGADDVPGDGPLGDDDQARAGLGGGGDLRQQRGPPLRERGAIVRARLHRCDGCRTNAHLITSPNERGHLWTGADTRTYQRTSRETTHRLCFARRRRDHCGGFVGGGAAASRPSPSKPSAQEDRRRERAEVPGRAGRRVLRQAQDEHPRHPQHDQGPGPQGRLLPRQGGLDPQRDRAGRGRDARLAAQVPLRLVAARLDLRARALLHQDPHRRRASSTSTRPTPGCATTSRATGSSPSRATRTGARSPAPTRSPPAGIRRPRTAADAATAPARRGSDAGRRAGRRAGRPAGHHPGPVAGHAGPGHRAGQRHQRPDTPAPARARPAPQRAPEIAGRRKSPRREPGAFVVRCACALRT